MHVNRKSIGPKQMIRRINIKRVITVIGCAMFILAACIFAYQLARARAAESILAKVDRLSLHPPKEIPELEWAILVYWTHNLHCNSMPQISLSLSELLKFNNDLSKILATGPNRESIDKLWVRYSSMSDTGARYREKFEPVRNSIINAAAKDGAAYPDRDSYTSFVASVRNAANQ